MKLRIELGIVALNPKGFAHTGVHHAGPKVYKSEGLARAATQNKKNIEGKRIDFVYAPAYAEVEIPNVETPGSGESDVSPHTLRHTFCISHLNAGTDIKFVSRWCGHKSTAVTEKHYAHAILGTLVASDQAYDESMRRQLVMTAGV